MEENRFDLHTHSIISDGTVAPSEIVSHGERDSAVHSASGVA